MDPKARREELLSLYKQTNEMAQAHAAKAQELRDEGIRLEGSIRAFNEVLGITPETPNGTPQPPAGEPHWVDGWNRAWSEVASAPKLNRAQRRRLKKSKVTPIVPPAEAQAS